MTAREFLGNDLITSFEKAGFSPESINTFAKTEYMKQKAEIQRKQRELESRVEASNLNDELKAKVIAGDIDERTAFEAQAIDNKRGLIGIGKGALKGVASIYNAAEEVADVLNPFYEGRRDSEGKYIHKNPIGKFLKPHIEKMERFENSWVKAHPDELNIKGAAGEMFGSLATDPINFIPLASGANLGRKMFYYASTGALSNSIYGTGIDDDKNVLKDAAIGAGGGVMLGGVMELAAKGINKLIAKAKEARIKEATSQADIDALNDNDFLKVDVASRAGRDNEKEGFGVKEYIDFYLHNSGEDVRRQVYDDYLAGKEKSVIDDEKFNDIKNFKSGIEFLSNPSKAEEYFASLQLERDAVMDSILRAKESSLTQYADMQKTSHKIAKENPNLRPRMLTELVNLAHKPSEEEAFITSLINNGQGVENRLSGYRILYAIENSFDFNIPEERFYARLKKAGFNDEAAQAFTDSYVKKDLSIANEYIGVKVDAEGEKFVIDRFIKTKEAEARINETGRAEGTGEAGRVSDSLFDLGDNASRAEAGQTGDAQISQNGGPDTTIGSENFGRAKIDEAVEERGAVKFNDADNARFNSEQVVSKEKGGISKGIEGGDSKSGEASNILAEAFTGKTFHAKPLSKDIISQNILSQPDLGGGLVGGTLNSIEEDENGNVRFSPEKFVSGFIIGLGGSKVIRSAASKDTKFYNQILGLAKKYPNMAKHNPKLLGKIYKNAGKPNKKDVVHIQGEGIKELAASINDDFLLQNAIELEPSGSIFDFLAKTKNNPSRDKILNHFVDKEGNGDIKALDHRMRYLNYILPTIQKPLIKVFRSDGRVSNIKPFTHTDKNNKKKTVNFLSVVADKEGNIELITAFALKDKSQIRNEINKGYKVEVRRGLTRTLDPHSRIQVPNATDEIISKNSASDKPSVINLYSFAGEKAITANIAKLDEAKRLLDGGADEVEIWQKTGWFRDEADGKWKFEINPKGGEIVDKNGSNLGGFLKDDELFEAYPELKNIKISSLEYGGGWGAYNPKTKEISLADLGDKSTLYHEIQHAIQDIEGFSGGGSGPNYEKLAGEVEARNVQNRMYQANKTDSVAKKEAKDINNVTYDNKKMAFVSQDIDNVDSALKYIKGDRVKGAEHIRIRHLSDPNKEGYVTDDELMSLGVNMRKFLAVHKEPFINKRNARIYEWVDKEGVKFTLVATNRNGGALAAPFNPTDFHRRGPFLDEIITFYSDRNFKNPMKFENPKLNTDNARLIDNQMPHPLHTLDVPRGERINTKGDGLSLSRELEKKYILKDGSVNEAAIRKEAELFIEKEYNLENFKAEFPRGKVDTPIGEVGISSSQFQKLERKGREKYLGLIKPTLERPAFVVDFEDTTFFFKPFKDKDGVVKFASVIKERDGGLDVISNYPMKNRKFELITREGKVRYVQGSVVVRPLEHSLDDIVRSSGGLKPIEHSSDKGIISKKLKNGENIDFSDKKVVNEIQKSVDNFVKDSLKDINVKDEILREFDLKNVKTLAKGKSIELNEAQIKTLKKDIKNSGIKSINENKFYFDKIGKDGDKKRFFVDINENGGVKIDGFNKADIDEIPVRKSAMDELIGKDKLKGMSFEEKAAYHNELDPIKKEKIAKTAELNRLKRAANNGDKAAVERLESFKAKNLDEDGNIKDGLELC